MTLLIRNVHILGGARQFPELSDVFVQNEKISAIGSFPSKKADEMIDGQGMYLAPGFIDVNTDSDHYLTLFDNPLQEDFLKQGVTTILGGMCGSSLAPLLYGGLESVRKWGDIRCINVGWHSMGEFLNILEGKGGLGVNFGTLVGHSTIRRALIGEGTRNLTKNEMGVFIAALRRGLREGGFGLSTGLGYVHGRGTSYAELKTLAGIVREQNGVYATHLRNAKEGLLDSITETLKLSKETGVKTLINHLLPFRGSEETYAEALKKLEKVPAPRMLYFDVYPFDTSVVPLYTLLPRWAQEENLETMNSNLNNPWKRKRILKELPEYRADGLIVAASPGNTALMGKSMEELQELYNSSSPQEALLALMRATELRAVVFVKDIAGGLIEQALMHPRALIASNAASVRGGGNATMLKPERAMRTFPKFLELVRERKLLSLEEAVQKLTKIPAALFGLTKRGVIGEGNYADLVGFTFREGVSTPVEIRFVAVNGAAAIKNGAFQQGVRRGKMLRHTS
jgi:N-acyl-D-amino-acid deacylase